MRIWSIHPEYLDTKALVAVWRETLLAKHVLEDKTNGYKNHPQLIRFRSSEKPIDSINYYLQYVYEEALTRGYNFDKQKIGVFSEVLKLPVTTGQVKYESEHLLKKLFLRDKAKYELLKNNLEFHLHPLFELKKGDIEVWEKQIVPVDKK